VSFKYRFVLVRLLQGLATDGEFASATAFLVESALAHYVMFGAVVGFFAAVFLGRPQQEQLSPDRTPAPALSLESCEAEI